MLIIAFVCLFCGNPGWAAFLALVGGHPGWALFFFFLYSMKGDDLETAKKKNTKKGRGN